MRIIEFIGTLYSLTLFCCCFLCYLVPPKDVVVQVQSLMVQEGGSALLACSCKADPPASEYRWSYTQHGRTMHLDHRTHTLRVFNVTRDMKVRCSAQNLIGQGESQPTPLNIQCNPISYRPTMYTSGQSVHNLHQHMCDFQGF